ncbi:MAG: HEAT repeat domain-containing protein [Candidatus Omnitrophota bacterium]
MYFQTRYAYFTHLIWTIDKTIFVIAVSLAIFIFFYAFIRTYSFNTTEQHLARIKKKIQVLSLGGKDILLKTSPIILLKASPSQIFNIIKEDGKVMPEQFREELQESIISSSQFKRVRRIAQRSSNIWKRIEAIYILSLISPDTALEILKKTIKSKNADMRYFSLLALGEIKNNESAKLLLENLNNPFFSRHKILSLLERFPDDITEEVIKKIDDPNPAVRSWCIKLLSLFTKKQYFEKIKLLTLDSAAEVRATAAECLGEYGNPDAREPLLRCLSDDAWFVKMQAARSLNKIFGKEYLNEISRLLITREWFLKETVKDILLQHFDDALPLIEQFIQSDDEDLRHDCVEILENANYITVLFANLLHNASISSVSQLRLLKAIVKIHAHLGIENALNTFGKSESEKILEIIGAFDQELKIQIENKLKNLITES